MASSTDKHTAFHRLWVKLPLMPEYRGKRPQSFGHSGCIRKNIENVGRDYHHIGSLCISFSRNTTDCF